MPASQTLTSPHSALQNPGARPAPASVGAYRYACIYTLPKNTTRRAAFAFSSLQNQPCPCQTERAHDITGKCLPGCPAHSQAARRAYECALSLVSCTGRQTYEKMAGGSRFWHRAQASAPLTKLEHIEAGLVECCVFGVMNVSTISRAGTSGRAAGGNRSWRWAPQSARLLGGLPG